MVMAIFKDRKLTNWTPQNQVIIEIEENSLIISESNDCRFNCAGLESLADIKSFLKEGDVNFSESNVEDHENRHYQLDFDDSEILRVDLLIYMENVEITKIYLSMEDCNCT